jgi:hypothetical protein
VIKTNSLHVHSRFSAAAVVVACFMLTVTCLSQGESAVPFLLISPYAEANGMGEASIATRTDDPLAAIWNPAHLGMQSLTRYFSVGTNTGIWLPSFNSDTKYRTLAINAGMNLGKTFGFSPAFSLGFGYSRVYLDLGEFIRTGSGGPEEISRFHSDESSDQWTIGIGLDHWIKLSGGLTFKHIVSNLSPIGTEQEQGTGVASVNAVDYGVLLDVPVMDIISRALQSSLEIYPHVNPLLDLSFGLSRDNLGDKVVYVDPAQADPLPRAARVGVGLHIGVLYLSDGIEWNPFSFKWTIEANDMLVRRYPEIVDSLGHVVSESHWEYLNGLGDISFFNEVILGKTNRETIKKKGWELNLFEVLAIRGGRFQEDRERGDRNFITSGFGIRLSGILKAIRILSPESSSNEIVNFLFKHVDVRYDESTYDGGSNSPLDGTKFRGISLAISN